MNTMNTKSDLLIDIIDVSNEPNIINDMPLGTKFQVGKKYPMRFIGDSQLIVIWECTKVTEKSVTLQSKHEKVTKKIHTDSAGIEYTFPYGKYAMCPVINANKHL